MIGIRDISGSAATRFRNVVMASAPSIIPSSILMSKICAPPSTWSLATLNASSKSLSLINLKNLRDPVTLVRSPIFTKLVSEVITSGSKPDSRIGFKESLSDIISWIILFCQFCYSPYMSWRCAATTTNNINKVQL